MEIGDKQKNRTVLELKNNGFFINKICKDLSAIEYFLRIFEIILLDLEINAPIITNGIPIPMEYASRRLNEIEGELRADIIWFYCTNHFSSFSCIFT